MAEKGIITFGGNKAQPLDFREKFIVDAGIKQIEQNIIERQKERSRLKNLVHTFILRTMFHFMNIISHVEMS
jgi:hypothetical protein